jgi:hypothetical protein
VEDASLQLVRDSGVEWPQSWPARRDPHRIIAHRGIFL